MPQQPKIFSIKNLRPENKDFSDDFWLLRVPKGCRLSKPKHRKVLKGLDFRHGSDYYRRPKEKLPAMESYLENQTDQTASLETFIKKVKSVMEPTELTAELLNEFIDKIYVHESRCFEGKRAQIIDIHYKGVGVLKEISPEEMEEQFKEHYLNKRKNGIA